LCEKVACSHLLIVEFTNEENYMGYNVSFDLTCVDSNNFETGAHKGTREEPEDCFLKGKDKTGCFWAIWSQKIVIHRLKVNYLSVWH